MSAKIFAYAERLHRKADKHANRMIDCLNIQDYDKQQEKYEEIYENSVRNDRNTFKKILQIAQVLHEDYVEICGTVNNQYFITVRPDTNKITFDDFYKLVSKYVSRKCFKSYTLSFEQKGTEEADLGKGFHVHIVADMTQRSKGEVLRDSKSTFACCTAENCIKVIPTRNPTDIITKYLINYESDDGHKMSTQNADSTWRATRGLQDLYEGPGALPPLVSVVNALSSSTGQGIKVLEGPKILELS